MHLLFILVHVSFREKNIIQKWIVQRRGVTTYVHTQLSQLVWLFDSEWRKRRKGKRIKMMSPRSGSSATWRKRKEQDFVARARGLLAGKCRKKITPCILHCSLVFDSMGTITQTRHFVYIHDILFCASNCFHLCEPSFNQCLPRLPLQTSEIA